MLATYSQSNNLYSNNLILAKNWHYIHLSQLTSLPVNNLFFSIYINIITICQSCCLKNCSLIFSSLLVACFVFLEKKLLHQMMLILKIWLKNLLQTLISVLLGINKLAIKLFIALRPLSLSNHFFVLRHHPLFWHHYYYDNSHPWRFGAQKLQ